MNLNSSDMPHFAYTQEKIQQSLYPTIVDPKLFLVRVKRGKERDAAMSLLKKYFMKEHTADSLYIQSAIFVENLSGYIYVEAFKENYVRKVELLFFPN